MSTIWYTWTGTDYTVSSTSTSTSTDDGIWNQWTSTSVTVTTTSTDSTVAWYSWNFDEPKYTRIPSWEREARPRRDLQAEEEQRKRYAKLQEEKLKAEEKAKELLLDLIGEKELAVYNETGRLFVKGKKFDYIIQKSGFIKQISKDKVTDLCVHLDNKYSFPETDNVIAMKLAIEEDESGVLKLANNHGSVDRSRELLKAACM